MGWPCHQMTEEMHLKPSAVGLRTELSSKVSTLPTGQEVLCPIPSTAKTKVFRCLILYSQDFFKILNFSFPLDVKYINLEALYSHIF